MGQQGDFAGGPAVKTVLAVQGAWVPWSGNQIPHATMKILHATVKTAAVK